MRVFAWTNHFLILAGSKTDEAWEFYMNLCIKDYGATKPLL